MKVFLISSPYIVLSHQLLDKVAKYLTLENKKHIRYLNVNSGQFDQNIILTYYRKAGLTPIGVETTTDSTKIAEICKNSSEDVVISCCYDSKHKILEAGIVPFLEFNDEAHILVGEEFKDVISIANHTVNLTATEKNTDSDNGKGMNNEVIFGKRIFHKSPKEMIQSGEIVPPVIHLVDAIDPDGETSPGDYIKLLKQVYKKHNQYVKEASIEPDKINAKLLVTIPGTEQLVGILNCINIDDVGVPIYAICSETGGVIKEPGKIKEEISKNKFLQRLNQLKDTDNAIVIQIQMLTTGIDVPGITGTLIFKNLNDISATQNIGRTTRLQSDDRNNVYNNSLKHKKIIKTASDLKKHGYIKPVSWVIIPKFTQNGADINERLTKLVKSIIHDDQLDIENLIIIDDDKGIDEKDQNVEKRKLKNITKIDIENIVHELKDLDFFGEELMLDELAMVDLARELGENAELIKELK